MANRPANAGSGRGLVPMGDATPPRARAPRPAAGHRATRPRTPNQSRDQDRADASVGVLAWVPYLIVLAGAVGGMLLAWHGSRYTGRGAGLLGASMLAAALARLVLPPRYAAVLSSRRKAFDVLTFAVFGAAVLGVAVSLP